MGMIDPSKPKAKNILGMSLMILSSYVT